MLKNILKLKGARTLNKEELKKVGGGFPFPPPAEGCGCIVVGRSGNEEIEIVDCDAICPDGSAPVPGLGF
ncbi:hypothetical protein GWK08_06600 [Leptobacterium flavescens]|uniref:Bacteriocin n=1 Tax=Leptobacterium flavescens TaxID=472055 RepID=A0A6P0UIC7_9FLAO|nr:hypothetical protein [Leptobacterium flavescens]NER13101.1 hypothetical protein [Leptobacterium flavescens]